MCCRPTGWCADLFPVERKLQLLCHNSYMNVQRFRFPDARNGTGNCCCHVPVRPRVEVELSSVRRVVRNGKLFSPSPTSFWRRCCALSSRTTRFTRCVHGAHGGGTFTHSGSLCVKDHPTVARIVKELTAKSAELAPAAQHAVTAIQFQAGTVERGIYLILPSGGQAILGRLPLVLQ